MARLRVGIDARLAGRGLGIATALDGLVRALAEKADVVWFGDPSLAPSGVFDAIPVKCPYPVLDSRLGRRLVNGANLDVFHFAANTGWGRSGPLPFVLTVNDLIFLDTGVRSRTLRQVVGHRYLRRSVRRAVRVADSVAVPTAATAADVIRVLAPPTAPEVIPYGIDLPRAASASAEGRPRGDYLVAFSAQDPRKGTELVVDAWYGLGSERPELWLLTGAGLPRSVEGRAQHEIERGEIRLLGYRPKDELWEIIAGARALLYPSKAEGFGFPVIEAMALGVPVVSGLSPATREIGGAAIVRIDPQQPVTSTRDSIRRLEQDREFRQRQVRAGLERAGAFSWEAAADAYLSLYRRVLVPGRWSDC